MSIVDRALWVMERNSEQALGLNSIADACGVSRSHLANAFGTATGWPVIFLTQALLPLLADGGRIINISTAFTRTSSPGWSVYASAKGALEVLTHFQAAELGARGITANTVAPGAIETDFGGGALKNTPDIQNYFKSITALGRTGQPDDVGAMVASLLSDDNRWINAQRIEVSGGALI